jgi:hypothetical protein
LTRRRRDNEELHGLQVTWYYLYTEIGEAVMEWGYSSNGEGKECIHL